MLVHKKEGVFRYEKLWTFLLTLVIVVGLISPAMITTAYAESGVVMTVNDTPYTDHATGWSAALELADHEGAKLENVNVVEYDFEEGINVVPQEVTNFTLTSGDKVMLWCDLINLAPVCKPLTIK